MSKEIIVIDTRVYRQMTGLCVTNAGQCERKFHSTENPISKKNPPTLENNKGLAKARAGTIKKEQQMPTAY